MEIKEIDGILTLKLDMIQTVALSLLVLFLGYFIKRMCVLLDRLNIPAPVVGGLTFATIALVFRQSGIFAFSLNNILQNPFMIAFFTTVGLTASVSLLKKGGPQIILFLGIASFLAFLQNLLGFLLARIMGVHPFLGLICGSVTMTGGHGTGLAFGPVFENLGMKGASTYAVAGATFGLVSGGLIGGPVGTWLIKSKGLRKYESTEKFNKESLKHKKNFIEGDREIALSYREFLKYMAIILICMWVGSIIAKGFEGMGITLPAYIGSMIFACFLRNFFDLTKIENLSSKYAEFIGSIALSVFLSMALMSLKLWELFELALPMLAILFFQVLIMILYAIFVTFPLMGKNYESAVMAAGHCGFGLGATPNAIANMEEMVEKYGSAPRAFLVIPIVGAFFIDFTNALIITFFTNILK